MKCTVDERREPTSGAGRGLRNIFGGLTRPGGAGGELDLDLKSSKY